MKRHNYPLINYHITFTPFLFIIFLFIYFRVFECDWMNLGASRGGGQRRAMSGGGVCGKRWAEVGLQRTTSGAVEAGFMATDDVGAVFLASSDVDAGFVTSRTHELQSAQNPPLPAPICQDLCLDPHRHVRWRRWCRLDMVRHRRSWGCGLQIGKGVAWLWVAYRARRGCGFGVGFGRFGIATWLR